MTDQTYNVVTVPNGIGVAGPSATLPATRASLDPRRADELRRELVGRFST